MAVFENGRAGDVQQWDRLAHRAVRDLHEPRPAVFWSDFLASALVGYALVALAVSQRPGPSLTALALVAGAFALYRALCFMHEIAHLRQWTLRGFEAAWNALIGVPLLMPSFVYTHGVHQSHHTLSTYGTPQDPEYLPFAQSHVMTVTFALHSVLIPLALVIRFVVLGPFALLLLRVHRVLVERASALAMHPKFVRAATPALLRFAWRWQAAIVAFWGGAIALAAWGVLPWRTFAYWYAAMAVISVVNVLRTLGAHHYEGDGESMDRAGQLLDSIETPGRWWSELWAPVGLRYHALHHYFPGIPYHHLPEAHRRLVAMLPAESTFRRTLSPGLPSSLQRLLATGRTNARTRRAAGTPSSDR